MNLSVWINIDKSSVTENCVNSLFRQFQLTGLLSCETGALRTSPFEFDDFLKILFVLIDLTSEQNEYFMPGRQPFIYNNSSWSSEDLCGYTSEKRKITLRDIFASYTDIWAAQRNNEPAAISTFFKNAIWFAEKNEDPVCGIKFLFDLYSHGYFIDLNLFSKVLDIYLRIYSIQSNLIELKNTSFYNTDKINIILNKVLANAKSTQINLNHMNFLLGVTCELTLERINHVRSVENLDQWIIEYASIAGPVNFCSIMKHATEDWQLSTFVNRMLSNIEEIGADKLADSILWKIIAENHLPPMCLFSLHSNLAEEYRAKGSGDKWLRELYDDRLVFPLDVIEIIESIGEGNFKINALPKKWLFPSVSLAFPFCFAHERSRHQCRSEDFTDTDIAIKALEMGVNPMDSKGRAKARLKLIELELEVLETITLKMTGSSSQNLIILEKFHNLYHWNALPRRILALLSLELNNEIDIESLYNCIMLEPNAFPNWLAILGYVRNKKMTSDEFLLEKIIVYLIHKTGKMHE